MTTKEERTRIILKLEDGGFTIRFQGEISSERLNLSKEELLELAVDLDVWRWRLTGDSYDPRVARQIHEESREHIPDHES